MNGRSPNEARLAALRVLWWGFVPLLVGAFAGCESATQRIAAIKSKPIEDGFAGRFSPQGSYIVGDSYYRSMTWPIDVFVSLGDYDHIATAGELRVSLRGRTMKFQIVDPAGNLLVERFRDVELESEADGKIPKLSDRLQRGDEWGHRSFTKTIVFRLAEDDSLLLEIHEVGTSTGLFFIPTPYVDSYLVRFGKIER